MSDDGSLARSLRRAIDVTPARIPHAATVVIVRRWLIAPARERRELLPVLVAGLVFLGTLAINLVRRIADVPEDVSAVLIAVGDLVPAAIPIALLIGIGLGGPHTIVC